MRRKYNPTAILMHPTSAIRAALVGAGRGSAYFPVLAAHPRFALTALCDADETALAASGNAMGVAPDRRFRDYADLLARGRPDLVILATPMQLHVAQAVQALEANVHVLSEVTAGVDIAECRALVRAARRSRAQYMMAENFCYFRANALVRALAAAGRFGRPYFAEGEYVVDCKPMQRSADGRPTWRTVWQTGKRGITYGTHSLGPALEFFGPQARVTAVACHGSGVHTDPTYPQDDTSLMLCHLSTGGLIKVRLDMLSNRPYGGRYFALQGTRGCYEAPRGFGDDHKLWLEDGAAPTGPRQWGALWGHESEYLPEVWHRVPEQLRLLDGGDALYVMLDGLAHSLDTGGPVPIDVYRAMDYTVPGLISEQSIALGGVPVPVPDLRDDPG